MMQKSDLRRLTEQNLYDNPDVEEYQQAEGRARRKLEWIISREGDDEGARLEPFYLAQLIAEEIRAGRMSNFCYKHNKLLQKIEEYIGTKKEMPASEPARQISIHPYCTTIKTIMQ